MTSITHVLVGIALGTKIGNPYLAGISALGAHFVCDMIPHWDWGTNHRNRPKWVTGALAITETVIALSIGAFFVFNAKTPWSMTAAIIGSLIPDWIEAPYHILSPNAPRWMYWIYKPQSIFHSRAQLPWGLVTQVVTVAIAVWWGFS